MSTAPHAEFARRAERYSSLDQRLAGYTRFFGAAALTNAVLAELCAHRARWIWLSPPTISAMMSLGGYLEAVNVNCARSIERAIRSPGSLDASFIEMEQVVVESILRNWARRCMPRYRQLIAELDRVLGVVASGWVPLRSSAHVHQYIKVLRVVKATAGRCPSFASCADRMRIGNALIAEIRASVRGPSSD
jgi:hypothetical protein